MALKRLFQVLAAEETQAGQAVSGLLSASNANYLVTDPELIIEPETFERGNINRSSISPLPPLAGVVTARLRFGLEMTGVTGGATTAPRFGQLLQACGMREILHDEYTIGSITSGPFFGGETATQTGTSATARVIHTTYDGASAMYMEALTGTPNGTGVWTGDTSGATVTPSVLDDDAGYSYIPASIETLEFLTGTLTGTINAGDVVVGQTSGAVLVAQANVAGSTRETFRVLDGVVQASETLLESPGNQVVVDGTPAFDMVDIPTLSMALIEDSVAKTMTGCRGTFSLSGEIGQAPLFQFEFTGLMPTDPTDAGPVSGVTYTSVTPASLLGITLVFGDDATTTEAAQAQPRIGSFSYDYANTLGIPRDASEFTGVYDSAHITSRASTGSVNVNVAPEAVYDFLAKLRAGTPMHVRSELGSTSGNQFLISSVGAVPTSEGSSADGDFGTRDMSFSLASRYADGSEADHAELMISSI